MLRLVLRDLLANLRIWLGALVVAAATAAVAAVCAGLIETGVRTGGNVGLALGAISGTVLTFSVVAAVVVTGTVTGLTVALQRRSYALWQLVGVLPIRVGLVVRLQLLVVALAGSGLGCLAMLPFLSPFLTWTLAGSDDFDDLQISFGPISAVSVVTLVSGLVVLSGSRAAGRAGRVSPLESLRDPELAGVGIGRRRWFTAGLLAVLAGLVTVSLHGTAADRLAVPLMLVSALLAGSVAAVGPVVLGWVLSGWTSVVPPEASVSWYLARASARANISRSSAVLGSLMVAVALVGSFYAANRTAVPGSDDASAGTVALILGGPVVLSLLGSAVALAMSGRGRDREVALLRAAGSDGSVLVLAAVWEAVMYVVTAVLLGFAVVAFGTVVGALIASTTPGWAPAPILLIGGAGTVLMLIATVVPTLFTLRRPVLAELATE